MTIPRITEVMIDKGVLNMFKARALRNYPLERAEEMWGTIEGTIANVCVINTVMVDDADRESVEFDATAEYGDQVKGLTLLGSIHTHSEEDCTPSKSDIESAKAEGEIFFGICAIRKTEKRRFVSFGFFQPDGTHIQLSVVEPNISRKKSPQWRTEAR
jgi:proteasome lid subunit RPN8/RPN11